MGADIMTEKTKPCPIPECGSKRLTLHHPAPDEDRGTEVTCRRCGFQLPWLQWQALVRVTVTGPPDDASGITMSPFSGWKTGQQITVGGLSKSLNGEYRVAGQIPKSGLLDLRRVESPPVSGKAQEVDPPKGDEE